MTDRPPLASPDPRDQDDRWRDLVARLRSGESLPFEDQWKAFRQIYSGRPVEAGPPLVWTPTRERIRESNLGRFQSDWVAGREAAGRAAAGRNAVGQEASDRGAASREAASREAPGQETADTGSGSDYETLRAWSVADPAAFWERVIARLGISFTKPPEATLDLSRGAAQPRWLPGAELNCVDSCFRADPDRPAIVTGREGTAALRTVTYRDLERQVNRFANGLAEHGLGAGQGVALYMPMTAECVVAYLGTIRAGGYIVSIADSFAPREMKTRLEIGRADAIVTVDRHTRGGKTFPLYEKVVEAGAPRAIVIPDPTTAARASPLTREGDVGWSDFLGASERFDPVIAQPGQVTNILFSSGTTGTPKAIPWNQLTPIKCAMDGHFHQDIRPGDVVAWPTNVGWMMGPWLIYASLLNQATIALYEGTPAGPGFARFVEDVGVTMLGVVPSLVRAWMASEATRGVDWGGIRVFSSTGEPSNQKDYLWLMSLTGYRAPVIEYCGGTEVGGGYITGTVVQPASPATFTTSALGLDFVILREDGRPAGPGEMGEVFLVPPSIGLSQELWNRDHDEVYFSGCPTGPKGEVLRRHGDQITHLHGGFYKAQGRADDTMNLGGIKVSSLELERVIDAHDRVYESAAVAVQPEGEGPERLVVHVVAEPDTDPQTLRTELGSMIAKQLNPLFKIYDLVVCESLPRTASNKLMRRTLRAQYLEGKHRA